MIDSNKVKNSLLVLGNVLRDFLSGEISRYGTEFRILQDAVEKSRSENGWFTLENIHIAFDAIASVLVLKKLDAWLNEYKEIPVGREHKKRVGVIMAGNIPLVGFHDFLCVYVSGHDFIGKLSSQDRYLIPALAQILSIHGASESCKFEFSDGKLVGFDAIIATGSNNTSRYFEYYFGNVPHIIRRNRSGIALITGKESLEELSSLCNDIFYYFGLGCRNVNTLLVPDSYDFNPLFVAMETCKDIINHNKYYNNYIYHKAIFMMNGDACLDNGFVLLKKSNAIASPVAVLNYINYRDESEAESIIKENEESIQCVVSKQMNKPGWVSYGNAQKPELNDYADGVDTMKFLGSL